MVRLVVCLMVALALPNCNCGGAYPRDQLGAEIQPDAAAVRISNVLFKFMQRHLESILRTSFETDPSGEYAIIYIPEGGDDPFCDELNRWPGSVPACAYSVRMRDGCIGQGSPNLSGTCLPDLGYPRSTFRSFIKVRISDLVEHLSIDIEPASMFDEGSIRIRITDLLVDGSLALYINGTRLTNGTVGLGGITCKFGKAPGSPHMLRIDEIDVSVQPRVLRTNNGPPTLTSTALVRAVRVSGLSLDATPLPSDQACVTPTGLLNCQDTCKLAGDILKLGSDAFNAVNDVIAPALPYIATPVANALMLALANKPLEVGGAIPIGAQSFIPKGAGRDLWVMMNAGEGAFKVTQQEPGRSDDPTLGFTLPMWAGAFSENSPCAAPTTPIPPYASQLPVFDGTVRLDHPLLPGTPYDEQYHFAMMVSQSYLNQVLFAVRNSGIMCAQLGSQAEGLLSSGSFVPTAGLMFLLAPPLERFADRNAPIMLKLQPGQAPRVELGNGAIIGRDANGRPIRNSLINLHLNELGLEFHLFSFDRFVRTFVLNVDLVVSASVNIGKNGKLSVSIDSIRAERVEDQFNELFPGYDFSKITEVIFSIFASQLSPEALSFDIPLSQAIKDALGTDEVDVRILTVRRDGPADDLLGAYLKLCDEEAHQDPLDLACYQAPSPSPVRDQASPTQPIVARVVSTDDAKRGVSQITVALGGGLDDEWQWSVDGGPYSRFSGTVAGTDRMHIDSPLFGVMGKHTVALRHRSPNGALDLEQSPLQLDVWLDPHAPTLRYDNVRGVVVDDDVTPLEKLSYRVDSGEWISAQQFEALSLQPKQTVVARDLGMNESLRLVVPAAGSQSSATQGCAQTTGNAQVLAFVVMMLSLRGRWRRQKNANQ